MPRFFILWTLHKIEGIMFKYKNVCQSTIMLEVDGKVKTLKPNQEFVSKSMIYNKFLIEVSERPTFKDVKKQYKPSKDEV